MGWHCCVCNKQIMTSDEIYYDEGGDMYCDKCFEVVDPDSWEDFEDTKYDEITKMNSLR